MVCVFVKFLIQRSEFNWCHQKNGAFKNYPLLWRGQYQMCVDNRLWFLSGCLYSAVSSVRVREWRFLRIIRYCYYSYWYCPQAGSYWRLWGELRHGRSDSAVTVCFTFVEIGQCHHSRLFHSRADRTVPSQSSVSLSCRSDYRPLRKVTWTSASTGWSFRCSNTKQRLRESVQNPKHTFWLLWPELIAKYVCLMSSEGEFMKRVNLTY